MVDGLPERPAGECANPACYSFRLAIIAGMKPTFRSSARRFRRRSTALFSIGLSALVAAATILLSPDVKAAGTAVQLDLDGPLGVATAEYIIRGIESAEESGANLVIIRMDTPGGLVAPMRDIVEAILNSDVPVVTYVSPGGARADSAGTYILLASHVAAMAPTTHLGAATPVSLTGDDPADSDESPFELPAPPANDEEEISDEGPAMEDATDESSEEVTREPDTAMGRKVLNDSIAYIRGLAERHGRNSEWAEAAVRDAATLTAEEALEQNVIDVVASSRETLLAEIDGMQVTMSDGQAEIDADVTVEEREPSWRIKFLSTIANPQIALLLMIVGVYGLLFEGYNPGAIVPGVVGVVCLLLAAYALQVIPVNYAGLALIIVGLALMVAEAFVPSFGALGLGGIAAFIFGSIVMFDSGIPGFGISIPFVVSFAVATGLLLMWLAAYMVRLGRRGPVSGAEILVGSTATAMENFDGQGKVWLDGEAWQAESTEPVKKDQDVIVTAMDGLVLSVEPAVEQRPVSTEIPNN